MPQLHLKPRTFAALILPLLLAWTSLAGAAGDKAWFVDKQGREHPGYSFKFDEAGKAKVVRAIRAQEAQLNTLLRKRGVVGSAMGWDEAGEPVIQIFSDGATAADVPAEIEGFKVVLKATGPVFALKYVCDRDNPNRSRQCPDIAEPASHGGPLSTVQKHRPVYNGMSVGHPNVTAGTIACTVQQGCHVLALSNNHVFADSNNASVGDLILQPGPFDGGIAPVDSVGTLFDWVDIVMDCPSGTNTRFCTDNRVDGALALVDGNDFNNTTFPDGYGAPSPNWMVPQSGMAVMKYGRTTRYTEGTITGINAALRVNFDTCCAYFVGQVMIEPTGSYANFAQGGDSGALLVARGGTNDRRPVGLVFALATNGDTFANPIDDVMSELSIDEIMGSL